jgi:hypothetical protein
MQGLCVRLIRVQCRMIPSVIKGEGLLKLIIKTATLAVLVLCLASCGKNSGTTTTLGIITVNGPGLNGSVPTGTTRLYTLANIVSGQSYSYTVRTEIATLGTDTTTPDGTLTVRIYESVDKYRSDPTKPITVLTQDTNYPFVYEANFSPTSSGNYVAAISGVSQTVSDTQFFYDLRLMSSSQPYLTSFSTSATSTVPVQTPAIATNVGSLQVYSGGTLTPSGSYQVKLFASVTSATTTTPAYPQIFVYDDASLKIDRLLYSAVTDSMNFIVTVFNAGTPSTLPSDPNNNLTNGVTIPGVPFTSASGTTVPGSPFIVVKGTSASQYNLFVFP